MAELPLVSVGMLAYNHRPFIRQSLESVLNQRRDFPIEIVISDDGSPDGTARVIDEYQGRYPQLFVRRDPPHNVGPAENFGRVWETCRGKYIALLEGDDWWHSPDKLRLQVEFMERHPRCAVSGHSVRVVSEDSEQEIEGYLPPSPGVALSDISRLVAANYLPTASLMYRRGVVPAKPAWAKEILLGDWVLSLLHALHGPVGFIDEKLATYRVHGGGLWTSRRGYATDKLTCQSFEMMRPLFPRRVRRHFDTRIMYFHHSLFRQVRSRDSREARRHLLRCARYALTSPVRPIGIVARLPIWFINPRWNLGTGAS